MKRSLSRSNIRKMIIKEYLQTARREMLFEKIHIKRNNRFLKRIQLLESMGFRGEQIDIIIAEDLKKYVQKAQSAYDKAQDIYGTGEELLGYGQQGLDVAKQISDFTGVTPQDLGIDIDLDSIDLDPQSLITKLLEKLGLNEAKEWLGGKIAEMLEIQEGSLTMDIIKKVMVKFDIEDVIDVATGQADCDMITQKFVTGLADGLLMMGLAHVDEKLKEEFPMVGMLFDSVEDLASNFLGIELMGEGDMSSPLVAKLYEFIGPKMEAIICKRQLKNKTLKTKEIEKEKGPVEKPIQKDGESALKEIFLLSNAKSINEIRRQSNRIKLLS